MPRVSAIAAIGRNRELGKGNELLWRIPDDLRRFKELTLGHPVIMGRKTFESIVASIGKPLPERPNIVVTRNSLAVHRGATLTKNKDLRCPYFVGSIEEAIERARELDERDVFIGGGAQIYEAALPYTDRLCLTLIDDEKEADSFFPAYEDVFTKIVADEMREYERLRYRWVDLER